MVTNSMIPSGITIYIGVNFEDHSELLIETIKGFTDSWESARCIYSAVYRELKVRYTRRKKIDFKALIRVLCSHQFSSLNFEFIRADKQSRLTIDVNIGSDWFQYDDNYSVQVRINWDCYLSSTELRKLTLEVSRLFERTNGVIGWGLASNDTHHVTTELTHIIYQPFNDVMNDIPGWHEDEIAFYVHNKDLMDKYIQKFYWANWLNAEHVRKLDLIPGSQRIEWAVDERLNNGGAYLQVSDTPYSFTALETRLDEINMQLAGLRYPGAPKAGSDYG